MLTQQLALNPWCEEHAGECWQVSDGFQVRCVDGFTAGRQDLIRRGYYYAGHHAGVYTFKKRMSQPLNLPLDWHIAASLPSHADEFSDPEY